MERTFTFCLNADKASDETYLTWTTIRFGADGVMYRLTNMNGNGQAWDAIGTYFTSLKAVRFNDDTHANRIAATILGRIGYDIGNAKTFGASYPKACHFDVTGSRVTAAPTLMGRNRDKNETNRSVERLMGKPSCYAGTDDETMKRNWNAILAMRAQDAADRKAARAAGIKVATYRALKGK